MKIIFLILSILMIFTACNNKKNQTSTNDTDTVDVLTEDKNVSQPEDLVFDIIKFDGTPTFNDFLSFFPSINSGYIEVCRPPLDECDLKVLPEKFNKLTGLDFLKKENLYIVPKFKKKINNFTLVFFTDVEENCICDALLATYDKSGRLIDSTYVEILPADYPTEESYLYYISEDNNFSVTDYFLALDYFWQSENGFATSLPFHYGEYTTVENYFITNDGKIINYASFKPLNTVIDFIEYLGDRNFEKAFKLQKVGKWGDYEHFSSSKAFGGIAGTKIDTISVESYNNDIAKIYCEAVYYDTVNGSASIRQVFTVKKIGSDYYITDMNVSYFERSEKYFDKTGKFNTAKLSLYNFTKKGFSFYLFLVSKNSNNSEEYPCAELIDSAKYIDYNHAVFSDGNCKIDFYFEGDSVKIVENGKCKQYRNEKMTFDAVLYRVK